MRIQGSTLATSNLCHARRCVAIKALATMAEVACCLHCLHNSAVYSIGTLVREPSLIDSLHQARTLPAIIIWPAWKHQRKTIIYTNECRKATLHAYALYSLPTERVTTG
ncbi:hypothetical protein AMTR_s00112p00148390 [Amborella trichopoda]|uniref:Uncharacterized protein n=1 Tax=Amborella trichopoda TaxID=13333 RepID=W1NSP2_AMBTC|nr:hypothetical protein AMTR_s00112p00148390 [Amborella trichopoda]